MLPASADQIFTDSAEMRPSRVDFTSSPENVPLPHRWKNGTEREEAHLGEHPSNPSKAKSKIWTQEHASEPFLAHSFSKHFLGHFLYARLCARDTAMTIKRDRPALYSSVGDFKEGVE